MQVRLGRSAVIATIVGTLVIPAVGSLAGPRKEYQDTRSKLESIREQIDTDEAKAGTLEEEIEALDASLRKLQVEVNRLDAHVERIEGEVRAAQARIDETQAEIDKIEDAATEQAVQLYKAGETDTIDALLDSESLAELDDKMEMLGVAARENTGALVRFGRLKASIREQSLELFEKKEELNAQLRDRSKVLDMQAEQRAEFQAKVAELRERLGINRSKERHFAGELADIRDQIVEQQAKNAVAALGTSNRGFIWPLNGNVTSYYGPRWGRMHTGIDIEVILASYYSGYGNAVIVDHGGGYSTLYAHMSSFNTSSGAYVDQGDVIGYVGCTGSCTGDHLHFEVRVNGDPVDPMPYLP
jgi:murein DD-endopeptidase MepM/ murein hydrolase activator NlpD